MALLSNDEVQSSIEMPVHTDEAVAQTINGISTIFPKVLTNRTIEIELGEERFIPKGDADDVLEQLRGLKIESDLNRELKWHEIKALFAMAIGYLQLHDVWSPIREVDRVDEFMRVGSIDEPPSGITELTAVSVEGQIASCHVYHFEEEPSEEEVENFRTMFSAVVDLGVSGNIDYDTTVFSVPPYDSALFAISGGLPPAIVSSRLATLDIKRAKDTEYLALMLDIRAAFLPESDMGGFDPIRFTKKDFVVSAHHGPYQGDWGIKIPRKVTLKQ